MRTNQNGDKGIMNGCVFKDAISDIGEVYASALVAIIVGV
jgi:hypothetical protein